MNSLIYRSKPFKTYNPQESSQNRIKEKNIKLQIVKIPNSMVQKITDIYRWRSQTQFPIVKIRSFKILEEKDQKRNNSFKTIQVAYEKHDYTLADLSDIPLFKIIYLLKQTLIGYQRLFSKYGSFIISEDMIFIDENGKCRVWINKQIHSNQMINTRQKQCELVQHIYKIFKQKTSQTKQVNSFFEKTKKCNSFFTALQYIQTFVEKQKINIPLNFKLYSSSKGAISLEKKRNANNLILTMSKKPNFLTGLELNMKDKSPQKDSKNTILNSWRLLPSKFCFSKPPMKVSGDTAPQSLHKVQSHNSSKKNETNQESIDLQITSQRVQKQGTIWRSGKQQRQKKTPYFRKFSSNTEKKKDLENQTENFEIKIHIQEAVKKQEKGLVDSIAESLTFCDILNQCSMSSQQNDEKLAQKKNEVFNVNGWSLIVDSLFGNKIVNRKSFIQKDNEKQPKKEPIKLDLLDKCSSNMCQSFMVDNSEF